MNGYKIIDFKNVELNDTGVTIDGVFDEIDKSDKPLIFTNVNLPNSTYSIGDTTKRSFFTSLPASQMLDASTKAYGFIIGFSVEGGPIQMLISSADLVMVQTL